jgi:hypothetical protein
MSSAPNVEAEQARKFEAHYAELSDEELVRLSADLSQLREIARPILLSELTKRGLESQTISEETAEKRFVGVSGWLAFFVVCLVLFSPIGAILELVVTYAQVSSLLANSMPVLLLFSAYALLRVSIMALGIYAGVRLIQKKPSAVRAARRYLIAVALAGILIALGAVLSPASTGDKSTAVGSALQTIIFSIIWSAYLERSKRVAATYGTK